MRWGNIGRLGLAKESNVAVPSVHQSIKVRARLSLDVEKLENIARLSGHNRHTFPKAIKDYEVKDTDKQTKSLNLYDRAASQRLTLHNIRGTTQKISTIVTLHNYRFRLIEQLFQVLIYLIAEIKGSTLDVANLFPDCAYFQLSCSTQSFI